MRTPQDDRTKSRPKPSEGGGINERQGKVVAARGDRVGERALADVGKGSGRNSCVV